MCQKETDEIIEKIRKTRKEVKKSPEAARAYLVKLGVVKRDGYLTKNYEGLCIPQNQG